MYLLLCEPFRRGYLCLFSFFFKDEQVNGKHFMFLALLLSLGTEKLKYYKNCIVVLQHPKYYGFLVTVLAEA